MGGEGVPHTATVIVAIVVTAMDGMMVVNCGIVFGELRITNLVLFANPLGGRMTIGKIAMENMNSWGRVRWANMYEVGCTPFFGQQPIALVNLLYILGGTRFGGGGPNQGELSEGRCN